jgi:hypothetical protein
LPARSQIGVNFTRSSGPIVTATLSETSTSPPSQLLCLLLLNLLNWTIFWYRPDGAHSPDAIADATMRTLLEGWRAPIAGVRPRA